MAHTKRKMMTAAIAGSLAAIIAAGGGTLAYLYGQTREVENDFKDNKVTLEISETSREYNIVPGKSDPKDPTLEITNTLTSYLFAMIKDKTDGIVKYEVADDWIPLPGYDKVYYRVVEPSLNGDGEAVTQYFGVVKDDKVDYSAALTNADMVKPDGSLKDDVILAFSGFAIQQEPFLTNSGNDVEAGALLAYAESDTHSRGAKKVTTAEEVKDEFQAAGEGEAVKISLQDDITLDSGALEVKGDSVVIDGNGHTLTVADDSTRILNINDTDQKVDVDISDVTLDASGKERCISLYGNTEGADISLDNVDIIADMYAINVASNNGPVNIKATNTTASTGWCAYQSWSPDCTATFENCTLIGLNDKTYNADGWNNFSTIVINQPATNNTVNLKNCIVEANQTTGNRQSHISLRSTNTTINSENTIYKKDGTVGDPHITATSQEAIDTATLNFD